MSVYVGTTEGITELDCEGIVDADVAWAKVTPEGWLGDGCKISVTGAEIEEPVALIRLAVTTGNGADPPFVVK